MVDFRTHSDAASRDSSSAATGTSKSIRSMFSKKRLGLQSARAADRADRADARGGVHQGRDPPVGNAVEEKQISLFNDKGNDFFGKGEYDAALRMYSEALKLLKSADIVIETEHGGEESMPPAMRRFRTARCLVNVAAVHIRRESYVDAVSALELSLRQSRLVEANSKHYYKACEVMADALENIGLVLFKQTDFEQSAVMYTDALEARRKCIDLMDANHNKWSNKFKQRVDERQYRDERNASLLELSVTMFYMALLKEKTGDIFQAVQGCEDAIRTRREVIPNYKQDPNSLNLFTSIGRLYCHETVGRYSDALGYLHEVHRMKYEKVGRDSIDVVPSLNSIAFVYNELGDYKKCIVISDRAIGIATNGRGLNKESCAAYTNKGDAHRKLGEYEHAISSYQTALATQSKCFDENNMRNAEVQEKLAEVYFQSRDLEHAVSSLQKSIEVKRNSLGPDSEELARTYSKLGEYHNKALDHSMGIKCHTRALRIFKHHDNKEMAATEHNRIASILKSSGDPNKAMEHYMAALWHSREARLPSTDPIVADTIKNVASFQKG